MSNIAGDLGTHPTHPYYNHGGTLGDSGHKNGGAGPEAGLPLPPPPADVYRGELYGAAAVTAVAVLLTPGSPGVHPLQHPSAVRDHVRHPVDAT